MIYEAHKPVFYPQQNIEIITNVSTEEIDHFLEKKALRKAGIRPGL